MENRTPREAALRDPSCERVAKTLQEKNPELASSHEHTKITTICRTTIGEKDQNLP